MLERRKKKRRTVTYCYRWLDATQVMVVASQDSTASSRHIEPSCGMRAAIAALSSCGVMMPPPQRRCRSDGSCHRCRVPSQPIAATRARLDLPGAAAPAPGPASRLWIAGKSRHRHSQRRDRSFAIVRCQDKRRPEYRSNRACRMERRRIWHVVGHQRDRTVVNGDLDRSLEQPC